MSAGVEDQNCLKEFARSGSEAAFRQLAERHTGMVFGTATRIVRDEAAAQEITQNVFVALARKAAFLPRDVSVAAWLHRCAVLEARNWLRGEIRRKERERTAGALMTERDESLVGSLLPALDEAMLDLPEKERIALLLRFHEQRSLREVGQTLGVSDDTAQKRVAKAVDLLTRAFRKRGYTVSGSAITLALLEKAATAVPAQLCRAALAAGVASAPSAALTGAVLLAAKFMSLTKMQTATACLLLAAMPVGLEWQNHSNARAENIRLAAAHNRGAAALSNLEARLSELRRGVLLAHSELLARQAELRHLNATPKAALPPPEQLYAWSPESDYVRLPKSILGSLRLTSERELFQPGLSEPVRAMSDIVEEDGRVSPVLLEALGLDAGQSEDVQRAFGNFAAEFHAISEQRKQLTNSIPPGFNFGVPEGERVYSHYIPPFPEDGEELKAQLMDQLRSIAGEERAKLLATQADPDMNSNFREFGKMGNWVSAVRAKDGRFKVARTQSASGTSYGGTLTHVPYEGLPEEMKSYFAKPVATEK
jgi:RNA polymerase sigma factor (sigma-70 family)